MRMVCVGNSFGMYPEARGDRSNERDRIAELLRLDPSRANVKATLALPPSARTNSWGDRPVAARSRFSGSRALAER